MEITQEDRKKLRDFQHKSNSDPMRPIGTIIEHRVQNPKTYKKSNGVNKPISEQDSSLNMPIIDYKPKFSPNDNVNIKSDIPINELPINPNDATSNQWLNMDTVEFDKLEWMTSNTEKSEKADETSKFDKNGRVTRDDDGHTIDMLINLLDSTYDQQVTYALGVIGKIAELAIIGFYDGAFSENIYQLIVHRTLLRVRYHFDSKHKTLWTSALKTLRSLICNTQVDEIMLDRSFPLQTSDIDVNQWLSDDELPEFAIDMKDIDCIKIDAIQALLERTNLITRFNNMLDETGLENIYYESMIDILIRIARHSPWACLMLNDKKLLDGIVNRLIVPNLSNPNNNLCLLTIKTLKFLRIVVQGLNESRSNGQFPVCYIPIHITTALENFYDIDCSNQSELLFRLHIESLRVIKSLFLIPCFHRTIHDIILANQAIIYKNLQLVANSSPLETIESHVSSKWQLAAHLIDFIGFFSTIEKKHLSESIISKIWSKVVMDLIFTWVNELIRDKHIPHIDISITISVGITHLRRMSDGPARCQIIKLIIEQIANDALQKKEIDTVHFMKKLIRDANLKTILPDWLEQNGTLRDPEGLPSFGSLNYNTKSDYVYKLNPIIDKYSPFILLSTILKEVFQDEALTNQNLELLINHPVTTRYLSHVSDYRNKDVVYEKQVQSSFLAQYEVGMILQLMILSCGYHLDTIQCKEDLSKNETKADVADEKTNMESFNRLCAHTISLVGLYNVTTESMVMIRNQLFEKVLLHPELHKKISLEYFTRSTRLDHRHNEEFECLMTEDYRVPRKVSDRQLDILLALYTSSFQINRYWIFSPLLDYFSNHIKDGKREEDWFKKNIPWTIASCEVSSASDVDIIEAVLQFNYSLLLCSPIYNQLHIKPKVEEYLCILACIFLDDEIFHDQKISISLMNNLKIMIHECIETNCHPFPDAKKIISYMNLPVADVFTKLVDQYESVSYGNTVFANFLLLFLTSKSDRFFKKLIFQDKSEVLLPSFNLSTIDACLPHELFFSEKESDVEFKLVLRRAAQICPPNSFMKTYCLFHSES